MKNLLLINIFLIIASSVSADPSNPKAQRGSITFLSSEMWTDLVNEEKKYPLRNITDGNPLTAWVFEPLVSSQKTTIGIAMLFNDTLSIDGISLINGYAKSEYLYKANNTIEEFELVLSTGETLKYTCQESLDFQNFQFETRLLKWAILHVTKVRKGFKYDDLCISELTATANSISILKETDDFIISNSGGEYESDIIYNLQNELLFNTSEWDFFCGSQRGIVNIKYRLLVYNDNCNDYGSIAILNLADYSSKNINGGIWQNHWIIGIKSIKELIISDGEKNYIYNIEDKSKTFTTLSIDFDETTLWNWPRYLEKLKKNEP